MIKMGGGDVGAFLLYISVVLLGKLKGVLQEERLEGGIMMVF